MNMRFIYPAILERVCADEVVVSFRDLPECRTAGCDEAKALSEAKDALAEAIAGRIDDDEPIPKASARRSDEIFVAVPIEAAAKAALALAFRRSGLSRAALVKVLNVDQQAVSRMLDPRKAMDTATIDRALRILGSELVLEVRPLAPVSSERSA